MAKLILNEARAKQYLAEPSSESNEKYELGEELLKELRSNSYSGRVEEDVVGHIAKILEILDSIKVDDMDPFQLRMMTFPLSLSGKARKWWMNEGDGKINTWEELVSKIFSKFYPLSCTSNYGKMCVDDEEGLDPLKFITWRNSKFEDHKKVDETTKRALLYSWIEVGNNEGLMDEDISSDDDRDQTNSSMITKPEIKIGDEFLKILHDNSFNDGKDIYEIIDKDYSLIPIPAHHDISNPDKLCQTEEFTVVQYSVGSCEEYITVGPCYQEIDDMFIGIVRFGNDHVAAILGYDNLQWGNILITHVYFVEGLRYNLFLVGQFCDSDLEVAFRRNTCFVRNLDGVDLLKGNRSTNLYTINLYEMISSSPICLMDRATSVEAWLWHQRLHLLHMDLCGPIGFKSINGKRALCYLKNDHEDIRNLGAKGDLGFFIVYYTTSCAYKIYNRRTKKVMETMNITFDELSATAYKQRNAIRIPLATPATLNCQTPNASTTTVETAPTPTNSSIEAPHGMGNCDPIGTPMETKHKLDLDTNETSIDGAVNMGLWYTKDFGFKLTAFSDVDNAGCQDTFKSTLGGTQFLGEKLVYSRVVDFTLTSRTHLNQFSLAHSRHPGLGTSFYAGNPVELSLMAMRRWVGTKDDVHLYSISIKATCSYSKLKDIYKASIKT
ncbi:hypothetical protein Tco_1113704 [Tanacetum coccineum]|uniref:Retroviral polymerase SH3-like domain-containing protein n=1 Tax=Tanacetum coccineum TaxID=301880 RepID=A0ABQ5IU36_9ASTR